MNVIEVQYSDLRGEQHYVEQFTNCADAAHGRFVIEHSPGWRFDGMFGFYSKL